MLCLVTENDTTFNLKAKADIPIGHKVALADIKKGDTIWKYGEDIGRAIANIKKGDHLHVHNVKTKRWCGVRDGKGKQEGLQGYLRGDRKEVEKGCERDGSQTGQGQCIGEEDQSVGDRQVVRPWQGCIREEPECESRCKR